MRVPLNWLREYVDPPLDAAMLAERLAMTGTEVERVERHGVSALEHFIVGKVLDAQRHPDADRLTVCTVDIGEDRPSQIVCGAPNVAAGQTVAVATPGAVMPDGTTLKKATLRGQESNGMILAEDEVAIGTDHQGIMVLEADGLRPGQPLTEVLPIATDVLVLEVTPNRPDCLGIYGVAREVHAASGTPLNPPPWSTDPGTADRTPTGISISVHTPKALCPRFTARVFENVTIGPSPLWLKARLTAAGQRPISNVVDITNYVMLLTGQPLHAFDLDRIAGAQLTIRTAHAREQIETLDGQSRTLDEHTVLIEDADGPTSIAGIMGGARSEVEPHTTRVLLEAANWNGANIHRTSLKLGLRSEASTRFEKQLQPEQAMEAQAVATQLMLELTGATLTPGTVDIGGPGPTPQTIRLRDAKIASVLGVPVPRIRTQQILTALEFAADDADGGLDVTVPAFRRADITREADLIEEVARIDGLDKLPATLPSRHGASGRLTETQKLRRAAADALTAQGLDEVVGWSFVSADLTDRLRTPGERAVELENPMSAEQSRLRTRLIGSLLDIAGRNRARGATTIRLFEAGAVYLPKEDSRELPEEPYHVGALLIGQARNPTWRDPSPRAADFFAVKGVLQALLDTIRAPWAVAADASTPFLHPGRAAAIAINGTTAGWIGEIHPLVARQWGIEETIAAFELDLDAVESHVTRTTLYEDLTSFPELREDLAVIVADSITAESVLATVHTAGTPLLKHAQVFDVYRDPERIGEHNVSLALRLSYRAPDRTLTDEEVAAQRAKIVTALEDTHGGRIRAS